ncbi:MAG: DUF1499 domain-containing protein [Burkholderiaceae bacterium]
MTVLKFLLYLIIILVIVVFVAGQLGLLRGKAPSLGVRDGKLKVPAKTPNSVTSQAALYPDHPLKSYAEIAPLTYSSDADAAMVKLKGIVSGMPRTTIITAEPGYLYAQCQTQWLKFVDDLEFVVDDASKVIHVRSASRVGRKDFGVNRARVEAIRAKFNAS